MNWYLSHLADVRALPLADRHYNRQSIGSPHGTQPSLFGFEVYKSKRQA